MRRIARAFSRSVMSMRTRAPASSGSGLQLSVVRPGLVSASQQRPMGTRSAWKPIYYDTKLYQECMAVQREMEEARRMGRPITQKKPIRTRARNSSIIPDFFGLVFEIYNGKEYVKVEIREEMIGKKLGEFAMTRKRAKHPEKKGRG